MSERSIECGALGNGLSQEAAACGWNIIIIIMYGAKTASIDLRCKEVFGHGATAHKKKDEDDDDDDEPGPPWEYLLLLHVC